MANLSKTTQDHEEIRRWAEERSGHPACVKGTGDGGDIGILRIDFPGYSGEESLQEITWDEFFEKFDERNLSLVYQEETSGGERSNFNKLISAETASLAATRKPAARKGSSTKKAAKKAGAAGANKRAPVKAKKAAPRAVKRAAKKAAKKSVLRKVTKKAVKKAVKKATGKKAVKKTAAKKTGATKKAVKRTMAKKAVKKTARRR